MMRLAMLLLAALALVLTGVIGLELRPGSLDEGAMQDAPTRPAVSRAGPAPTADAGRRQAWVDTVLARPLFAPDRRPPAAGSASASAPAPALPRVTGIMMTGTTRSVIFAAAEGGRPVVATEGAEVNGFRVQRIEAGQVTLTGPDGPRVLLPTFDPRPPGPPPAAAPASGIPGLPSLQNLTGIPGLTIPQAPPPQ